MAAERHIGTGNGRASAAGTVADGFTGAPAADQVRAAEIPAPAACAPSQLFDGIANWLIEEGLGDAAFGDILGGLGRRLLAGGVPVHRISTGGLFLHPVFGAIDTAWDSQSDRVTETVQPRSKFDSAEFRNSPFFQAALHGIRYQRFRLSQAADPGEYPLLKQLRASNVTDYLVFYRDFGRRDLSLWNGLPQGMEGALGSFATRRTSGFHDREIAHLFNLSTVLSMVIKSKSRHMLTGTLLQTYLGAHSSRRVLQGLIERGSGRKIDCVIWLSDLRQSTRLAETLSMDDYLSLLNTYFDCTAGAVLDHGGEVLKFIGDAVLAIFPFEDSQRPAEDMCRAALCAAREAHARTSGENRARRQNGQSKIRFGVALHAGTLMYGNVGTDRRLDFTVIGPAANEVARLESFCKTEQSDIVVSTRFADLYPGDLEDIPARQIRTDPVAKPAG